MPQTEGSGAHRGNEIRIGIDHHYFDRPRQLSHEAFAENVAGAYGEQVVEDLSGIRLARMTGSKIAS